MSADTGSLSRVQPRDAIAALASWNLRGTASALPGERDGNFGILTDDGSRFFLKFCADDRDDPVLALQHAALDHLAASDARDFVPRVVPLPDGSALASHSLNGNHHGVRLSTWLEGDTFATWRPRTPALLHDIGHKLGTVAQALASFTHPAARRDFKWELSQAGWIRAHTRRVGDAWLHEQLDAIVAAYDARVAPALAQCRRRVVHNDANDHNILVAANEAGDARVTGIIDFGDLIETPLVCDLAIALAYTMMDCPDPLSAGAEVVRGYHEACPLEEREIDLLFALTRTRLAVSLVNAAIEREASPANEYLQVSTDQAARLLRLLDGEHERYATYRFRAACDLEPCPLSARVSTWIDAHRNQLHRVCDWPLDGPQAYVHDYSVSSTGIGNQDVWRDQAAFSDHVDTLLARAGAKVGMARYDEVRAIYTTDLFRFDGNEGPEWRTVHLGIDVNLPVGAPVYAPLDGVVHSLRDNTTPGDYGPTVVLEHRVDGGALVFWSLYGHLDREALGGLSPGDVVRGGGLVGHIGDRSVNGGWWPHVHIQLICDTLGRSGDFTGVARPIDRDVWLSVSPDPSTFIGAPRSARAPLPETPSVLLDQRRSALGANLGVSYRRPLHIVRGMMQHLVAADGRRYLDAVNNVAHVGHEHPDVVSAGQRQMAALNTNTRYLHELLIAYADRLTATLPSELSVCYFVCSGSEANELALRLARAATGARDTIVLRGGYHGNTTTLVDISSYKFDGPGGSGPPDWVHPVPAPDVYRGLHRDDTADAGRRYAEYVGEALEAIAAQGRRPAAFIAESVLSCAGQVVLPQGYLADAYARVRKAGGVCIADEVQVGLGRVGTHMWAFEAQGVVPDIVTMGKPLGNGHPIGAVVTTSAIAAAFATGMEYFNTFGGNPVSCAIGLAVLDVVEREGLRRNALQVGETLRARLTSLAAAHPLIGDVRGLGLFLGIELVESRDARTPATRAARYIANRMRDLGVLVSTDGPDNNVLKIKPPMCFTEHDAEMSASTLEAVLKESPLRG